MSKSEFKFSSFLVRTSIGSKFAAFDFFFLPFLPTFFAGGASLLSSTVLFSSFFADFLAALRF